MLASPEALPLYSTRITQEEEETIKTPKKARYRPQNLQMPIIQVSDTFIVKKLQIREEKASAIIQISP